MVSSAKGGRPMRWSGECWRSRASSACHGITWFISSRNSRLRVRLMDNSNPLLARLICFMDAFSHAGPSVG